MRNKVLLFLLVSSLGAGFTASAQQSKSYADWPDTDPEWNTLTNHILWCYNELRAREYAAAGDNYYVEDWEPSLVCPFDDYRTLAERIDKVAAHFVCQELAGNDDFSTYFAAAGAVTGKCPDDFPVWAPEQLHSNAFGRCAWSTNVVLESWIAVTNRALAAEVTAALLKLKWTAQHFAFRSVARDESNFKENTCWSGTVETPSPIADAVAELASRYQRSVYLPYFDGRLYMLGAGNSVNKDGSHSLSSFLAVSRGVFLDPCVFEHLTNRPSIKMPEVVAYMVRCGLRQTGYSFPDLSAQQTIFYCGSLGRASLTERLYCWDNPLADRAESSLPLRYAGLDREFYKNASYWEGGDYAMLLKWRFDEASPPVPDAAPVETPDTDRDDIVDVVPVEAVPGHETGCFVFTHEDEDPILYLPLAERLPWEGNFVRHAYLTQSPRQVLPYQVRASPYSSQLRGCTDKLGYSLVYSLDTRLEEIGVVSNETGLVKQVLIVRPRGQAVIFDFPWEGACFSSKGYPVGINRNLGYVLWHDGDKADGSGVLDRAYCGSYYLVFPSGIVHCFGGAGLGLCHIFNERDQWGDIDPVTDPSFYVDKAGAQFMSVTGAVNEVVVKKINGLPVQVDYVSRSSGERVERVDIVCQGGVAGRLVKHVDREAGSEVQDGGVIHYEAGFSRKRSQAGTRGNSEGFSVTLSEKSDSGALALSSHDIRRFDGKMRLMTQTVARDDGSASLERTYTYCGEARADQRLAGTGQLVRRLVRAESVGTSFGKYDIAYSYTPQNGWLSEIGRALGGGLTEKKKFLYDEGAVITTNEAVGVTEWNNPARLSHLRAVETYTGDGLAGRVMVSIDDTSSMLERGSTPGSGWGTPGNSASFDTVGGTGEPLGHTAWTYTGNGGSWLGDDWYCSDRVGAGHAATQLVRGVVLDRGFVTNEVAVNARGTVLRDKRQAKEGLVFEETVAEVDGRGRETCRRFLDGTQVCSGDYGLHGPRKLTNRDLSETRIDYDSFGRIKKKVDGVSGITSEYEYDSQGHVIRQTRTASDGKAESFARYGLDGALLYSKDETGHETSVSGRNEGGCLVLTRTETGRGDVVETYWADGVVKSVAGAGAHVRFNRERGVTDNKSWIKAWNADKPEEWVKDWYSFNGLYACTERPGGVTGRVEYDERLNLKGTVSGDNVKSLCSYDQEHLGLPSVSGVSVSGGQALNMATDPFCVSNAYSFAAQGLKTTRYSYPEDGSPQPFEERVVQVAPGGRSGTFEVNGRRGSFSCDAPPSTGTYTKTDVRPDGAVEVYAYRKHLLRQMTRRDAGALRKVTKTFMYNGFGELVALTSDEKGYTETISVQRDKRGLISGVDSSSRGTTTVTRNAAGVVSEVSSAAFGTTSFGWLENGLLGSVMDTAGPRFSRTVDAFGRDVTVLRECGGVASSLGFVYGDDGGVSSKVRDGIQMSACISRRADGRANTVVLPGGVTVNHEYDEAGCLKSCRYVDPADAGATVAETYSWRRDGGLRKVAQSGGPELSNTVLRVGNRVVSNKTVFRAEPDVAASVVTSLDGPGGRKNGVTLQFDGFTNMALAVGAEYNELSLPAKLSGNGFCSTLSSSAGGLVTNTLLAVGDGCSFSRTVLWSASAGKPMRVDYAFNGQFVRRWQYAFTNGLIASVSRSGGDSYHTDYVYDGARQLLSASSRSASNITLGGLSFAYAYSAAGDTIRFGRAAAQSSAYASGDLHSQRTWTPNISVLGRVSTNVTAVQVVVNSATNRGEVTGGLAYAPIYVPAGVYTCTAGVATLVAIPPQGTADCSRVAYSLPAILEKPAYDARGMILADSRRRYRWDALGRLMAVTNSGVTPAVALSFTYYPDGRRASKTVMFLTNGEWRVSRKLHYAWEGWKLAAECERNATNAITAVRHFVWGPDIYGQQTGTFDSDAEGIGGLLLIREWKPENGVRAYLPLTDGLGSVCGLVNAADGSLAAEFDYDPYGTPVVGCGPAMDACPFRHRTRYYDPETWLYYYGYRYYDPSVTKWISKDPLGEAGGWNLTCFCDNDPVNKFDALGLESWWGVGVGGDTTLSMFFRSNFGSWSELGSDVQHGFFGQPIMCSDLAMFHMRKIGLAPLAFLAGDSSKGAYVRVENSHVKNRTGRVFVLAVNGVNNTMADFGDDLEGLSLGMSRKLSFSLLSDTAKMMVEENAYPVHYVYNDSCVNYVGEGLGTTLDVGQAFLEFGGMGMVDATSDAIAGAINSALTSGDYDAAILVGHSHGGIKIATGFAGVLPRYRSQVAVLTYGSAHVKPFVGAAIHVNVHKRGDSVSDVAGARGFGFGPRVWLSGVFENGLGTDVQYEVMARGKNWPGQAYFGLIPNQHSFDLLNDVRASHGYSSAVPQLLHVLIDVMGRSTP